MYLMDGDELKDIDGNELYHEFQIFKSLVEINSTALQSLSIIPTKKIKYPLKNKQVAETINYVIRL